MSTFLSSKAIIDGLLANPNFVSLAQSMVTTVKGSFEWAVDFENMNVLLTSLGITQRLNIFKSDGSYYYDNGQTQDQVRLIENHNTRPEVIGSVNYCWGNPICKKKIYPDYLQQSICTGYGLAERLSTTLRKNTQYVAFTYKSSDSPLNNNIFTVRVSQSV